MRGLAVAVLCTALAACSAPLPSSSLTTPPSPTAAAPSASPPTAPVYADGSRASSTGRPCCGRRPPSPMPRRPPMRRPSCWAAGNARPAPLACLAQPQHVLALSARIGPSWPRRAGRSSTSGSASPARPRCSWRPCPTAWSSSPTRRSWSSSTSMTPAARRVMPGASRRSWSIGWPGPMTSRRRSRQPVLSIRQGVTQAATASTSQAFLIGGWFAGFGLTCAAPPADTPMSSLVPWCDGVLLTDMPYEVIVALHDTQAAVIQPIFLPGASPLLPPQSGRVVYRVHVHDRPRPTVPPRCWRDARSPWWSMPSSGRAFRQSRRLAPGHAEPDRRCPVMRAMQAVTAGLVFMALLACTATRTP